MKNIKSFFFFLFCFNAFFVKAQFIEPSKQNCFYDEFLKQRKKADPTIQSKLNTMDLSINQYLSRTNSNTNITIPVVVYIVHSGVAIGTAENISVNQVLSQINKLNEYFTDTGIQFCMATMNNTTALPGTAPNPGIIRISNLALTDVDATTEHAALTATSTLPSSRYLRIWVVRSINNGAANGYSILPDVVSPAEDGIVMDYKAFGDQATCGCTTLNPNTQNGKILVHEVGHYFGLYHTFEGGCNGMTTANCHTDGDRVCDTPPVSSPNSGCTISNSCAESPNLPDDINNYMDYTNETCLNHFTTGQINRMNAMIALYKSIMISATNQTFTGINCNGGLLASFTASNNNPCASTLVTFTANPISGVTSYAWDFGDGTTATGQVVTKTYTTALSPANVTLTISNGTNSASTIQSYFIEACTPITNSESNWYFYNRNAISFSTGVPVYNSSAFLNNTFSNNLGGNVSESSAVQSDSNGNLLFYTDGRTVWNQNHVPLGSQLRGAYSSSSGALIIPDPGNSSEYYIFTSDVIQTPSHGFTYSKVQVDGNNNATMVIGQVNIPAVVPTALGYQTATNTAALLTNEPITAIKKSDGYWIVVSSVKNFNSLFLVVFNLTQSGLSYKNEMFVGNLLIPITATNVRAGNIQASPNGKKIVIINGIWSGSENFIFDFDICNGSFSNQQSIGTVNLYGAEFSPNSKLLYTTAQFGRIFQYDLESCNLRSSLVANIHPNAFGSLQKGPNNKIYSTVQNTPQLVVINNPNNLSTASNPNACNYNFSGPVMQNNTNVSAGLPNMIDAKTTPVFSNSILYSLAKCATACYTYNFEADICTTSYNWNFGDPASGTANNTASTRTPSHTFSAAGTYTVTCVTSNGTFTSIVVVGALPDIVGATVICPQNNMIGNYSTTVPSGYSVVWSATGGVVSGLNNQPNVTINWSTLPGTVTLSLINTTNQCTVVQNQAITFIKKSVPTFTQVAPICLGETLAALPTTSNNGIVGSWSPDVNNLATTTYTFTPLEGMCTTTATMTITILPETDPNCDTNCPPSLVFSTIEPAETAIYKASNTIVTQANYIVDIGSTIGLRAGTSIVLKPNSRIKQGSTFTAKIQDCNVSGRFTNVESVINDNVEIVIYPNPFSTEINVSVTSDKLKSITITSLDGKIIYDRQNIESDYLIFNTNDLQKGMYILISKTVNGNTFNNKIIKN